MTRRYSILFQQSMGKKNRANLQAQQKHLSHSSKVGLSIPIKKTKPGIQKESTLKKLENSLFKKTAPTGGKDKFAALGYDQQHEQIDQQEQPEGNMIDNEQQVAQNNSGDVQEYGHNEQEIQQNELNEKDEADFGQNLDVGEVQDQIEGQYQYDKNQLQDGQGQLQDPDFDAIPLQEQEKYAVQTSVIAFQIQQITKILLNIDKLGNGKPKKYYVESLKKLLNQHYGYKLQLVGHFLAFLKPNEVVQLFQSNLSQSPLTLRTNTLKTRRKDLAQYLIQRGVNFDSVAEWSKVGIKINDSKVPIGATPEYLAGLYIIQSASSFLPVLALDPQPQETILDLCAAPGGKTTYIAQLMKNTGCVFANDLKKERLRALQFNLHRMGVTNTVVTCRDGRKYSSIFPRSFDRVIVDTPSTGLGIIAKDPSIKVNTSLLDIQKNSNAQKDLLLAAIDCAKVGGIIVYCNCSISPLQNEQVVNFALQKRFVKVVDIQVEVGSQGLNKFAEKRYHKDLKKTRRIYPHLHSMDGFYVAKLTKIKKGRRKQQVGGEEGENN